MVIHDLSEVECQQALTHASYGRLGCARDDQPYVVPIYFAYDGKHLYGFTTLGQKVEWMRSNPLVCLEVDERTSHDHWTSVIVFGRYEELPDTREHKATRALAHEVLQKRAMWWEPAYIATKHRDHPHSLTPIFYRIHIRTITGQRATSHARETSVSGAEPQTKTWLGRILRHTRAKG